MASRSWRGDSRDTRIPTIVRIRSATYRQSAPPAPYRGVTLNMEQNSRQVSTRLQSEPRGSNRRAVNKKMSALTQIVSNRPNALVALIEQFSADCPPPARQLVETESTYTQIGFVPPATVSGPPPAPHLVATEST